MAKHIKHASDETPADLSGASEADERIGLTEAFAPVSDSDGSHAGGFSYRGDSDDEYPDALDSPEPQDPPAVVFDGSEPVVPDEPAGKHGRQRKDNVPPYQRKSRRMRRILIAVIVLLVLLLGALGFFAWQWFNQSQLVAAQQAQEQKSVQDVDALAKDGTSDADTATTKTTDVPDLVALLGRTQEEAVAALQRGATVTSTREVNEEGNPIKTSVTVALSGEPSDTRSGTPTVYLGLGEDGAIVQAGYSAATASLGYGSLSFVDAVENDRIIEKTLQEAGIAVSENTVELPEDRSGYSTYASDGTTLVKESCSFNGTADIDGAAHEWSSVLLYDYTTANASGNLADTIRTIYVYINA